MKFIQYEWLCFTAAIVLLFGAGPLLAQSDVAVGDALTEARSTDGQYISWREHIIDDAAIAGFGLSGSDGLVMGDIDRDGDLIALPDPHLDHGRRLSDF